MPVDSTLADALAPITESVAVVEDHRGTEVLRVGIDPPVEGDPYTEAQRALLDSLDDVTRERRLAELVWDTAADHGWRRPEDDPRYGITHETETVTLDDGTDLDVERTYVEAVRDG